MALEPHGHRSTIIYSPGTAASTALRRSPNKSSVSLAAGCDASDRCGWLRLARVDGETVAPSSGPHRAAGVRVRGQRGSLVVPDPNTAVGEPLWPRTRICRRG